MLYVDKKKDKNKGRNGRLGSSLRNVPSGLLHLFKKSLGYL